VDIEGSEDLLFDSTSDYTLRRIHQITIEFHDFIPGSISSDKTARISRRLESLGFYCIPFSYMVPKAKNTDLLFIQCDECNVSLSERACFSALRALLQLERAKSSLRSKFQRGPAEPEN
jgi:phenylalanyl-tRNA synthetase beta subunit